METQKRVAREKLEYAGKVLSPGDEFDCELGHTELLVAYGKIEPRKGEHGYEPKKGESGYKTRHLAARGSQE